MTSKETPRRHFLSLEEEWRPLSDHPQWYVSSHARVKRVHDSGKVHISKPHVWGAYERVKLSYKGSKPTKSVHVLVALAFIGPRPIDGWVVNHKDLDKLNNLPYNLEWISPLANMHHAMEGLGHWYAKGEDSGPSKLLASQVLEIVELLKTNMHQSAIAELFGVNPAAISDINIGRSWSHLTRIAHEGRVPRKVAITEQMVSEIKQYLARGMKYRPIARICGIDHSTVSNIARGITAKYKDIK